MHAGILHRCAGRPREVSDGPVARNGASNGGGVRRARAADGLYLINARYGNHAVNIKRQQQRTWELENN